MSRVDIALSIAILIGAFSGYRNGFLMGIVSLVALVLGVFLGFKLMGEGMSFLQERFNADKDTLPYLSFTLIFIIVVILVSWMGKLIHQSLDKTFLGQIDQAMGALLGAFKIMFMASVILWIADSLNYRFPDDWTENSWLFPAVVKLGPGLATWLAQFIPFLREIFPVF